MAKTLKDIAMKLNLSISTVSCALKDGPKVVSPEVKRKVRRAAEEIGYRPNRIARSLVTGRTHTIGVVPMYVNQDTLLQPYLQLALNGIFNAAWEHRHDVLVYTACDHNTVLDSADDLLDSRADGVIFISPKANSPVIQSVSENGLPYAVLFENSCGNCFTIDNRVGVFTALNYLYELGHRRICHIMGDQSLSDGRLRRNAFIEYMDEHALLDPSDIVLGSEFTYESGMAAGEQFAKQPLRHTAVFCANDDVASGFMLAIKNAGIRCPDDVSIVGFDGVTPAGTAQPALTTIRQPAQAMAAEALRSVVLSIETGCDVQSQIFSPEIIVRASTGPAPLSHST